jgi:hypothetical protein
VVPEFQSVARRDKKAAIAVTPFSVTPFSGRIAGYVHPETAGIIVWHVNQELSGNRNFVIDFHFPSCIPFDRHTLVWQKGYCHATAIAVNRFERQEHRDSPAVVR